MIAIEESKRYHDLYNQGLWLFENISPDLDIWSKEIRTDKELYRREVDFLELAVALGMAKEFMEDNR